MGRKKKRRQSAQDQAAPGTATTMEEAAPEEVAAPKKSAAVSKRLFWFLFALAVLVRIPYLGKADLWGDEVIFVQDSTPYHSMRSADDPYQSSGRRSVMDVYEIHRDEFLKKGHVPLPGMVNNMFLGIVSSVMPSLQQGLEKNAFLQRLPGVFWGAFTVPFFFMLMSRLFARRIAWYSVLMMLAFYFPVHYSREAYVYTPLLFFSTVALYLLVRIIQQGGMPLRDGLFLLAAMIGACFSHLTGILLVITLFVLCSVALAKGAFPAGDKQLWKKTGMRIWLYSIAAILSVFFPFYKQKLFGNEPPHVWPEGHPFHENLYDLVGKVFLGSALPLVLISVVFLILGLITLFKAKEQVYERRLFFWVGVIAFVFICWGAISTQYTPRYFYLVLGFFYAVYALGIDKAAGFAEQKLKVDRNLAGKAAIGLMLALHAFFYLPSGYALTAKAKNFGGMAEWLVQNLRPGSAYVFESGYDNYFVPGFFPTPGLVGAAPYIHQGSLDPQVNLNEMNTLRGLQQRFFEQFPDSAYVEASRHGSEPGTLYDVWTWPYEFFQQVVYLTNQPLRKLVKRGIYPPFRDSADLENEYITPIWYNTKADARNLWKEKAQPVFISYPDTWSMNVVGRNPNNPRHTMYGRVIQGGRAPVEVENLTGEDVTGYFKIIAAVAASRSFKLDFKLDGKVIHRAEQGGGRFWGVDTGYVRLTPGMHELNWGVSPSEAFSVNGLSVQHIQFMVEEPPDGQAVIESLPEAENQPAKTEQANPASIQWTPPGP